MTRNEEATVVDAIMRLKNTAARLIILVFSNTKYEEKLRPVLRSQGVRSPLYQFTGGVAGRVGVKNLESYRGFEGMHGTYGDIDSMSPFVMRLVRAWTAMKPEYINDQLETYGIDKWEHPLDLDTITEDVFSPLAIIKSAALAAAMTNAFYAMVFAMNSLLHEGHPVSAIRGKLLLDEIYKTNFEGVVFKTLTFDTNGDARGNYTFQYLVGGGVDMVAWADFALYDVDKDVVYPKEDMMANSLVWATMEIGPVPPATLLDCPAGTWLNTALNAGVGVCELCPKGQITNEPEQLECYRCPPGRFGSEDRLQCLDCPRGFQNPDSA